MPENRSEIPDPWRARDAAEFILEMRGLRIWSGLTFRQLERAATDNGHVLPHSTLVTALRRDRLPREELLRAFISACGCDAQTVDDWLAARRRLALITAGATTIVPTPNPQGQTATPRSQQSGRTPGRRAGRTMGVVAGVMTCLPCLAASGPPRPTPQAPPARIQAGRYLIRAADSPLCLSELPTSGGRVHRTPCGQAVPAISIQPLRAGLYLILSEHPSQGPGCLGIRNAQVNPGMFVYFDFCGERGGNAGGEVFRLEPAGTPYQSFTIRPAHNDLCLGFPVNAGASALLQLPCNPQAPEQTFILDPH